MRFMFFMVPFFLRLDLRPLGKDLTVTGREGPRAGRVKGGRAFVCLGRRSEPSMRPSPAIRSHRRRWLYSLPAARCLPRSSMLVHYPIKRRVAFPLNQNPAPRQTLSSNKIACHAIRRRRQNPLRAAHATSCTLTLRRRSPTIAALIRLGGSRGGSSIGSTVEFGGRGCGAPRSCTRHRQPVA